MLKKETLNKADEADRWYFGCEFSISYDPMKDSFNGQRLFRARGKDESNEVFDVEYLKIISVNKLDFTVSDVGKLPIDGEYDAELIPYNYQPGMKMIVKGDVVSFSRISVASVICTTDKLQSRAGGGYKHLFPTAADCRSLRRVA